MDERLIVDVVVVVVVGVAVTAEGTTVRYRYETFERENWEELHQYSTCTANFVAVQEDYSDSRKQREIGVDVMSRSEVLT